MGWEKLKTKKFWRGYEMNEEEMRQQQQSKAHRSLSSRARRSLSAWSQ
jgi:hypothetical protein